MLACLASAYRRTENLSAKEHTGARMKWYSSTVALQIKVEFGRMGDVAIDDRTCRAVPTRVGLPRLPREESHMMALPNHQHGYLRLYPKRRACS